MEIRRQAVTCLRSITLAIVLSLISAASLWADSRKIVAPPLPSPADVQYSYGHLPLSFEANHGQVDPQVQFLKRGRGHTLYLSTSDAVLTLRTGGAKSKEREDEIRQSQPPSRPSPASHSVVRMTFDGANPQAKMVGLDQLPGIVNYLIGGDPSKWRTNIPTYQKVAYTSVYPGIDLVYYGNQGQLEYDLIVAPGADPKQIRLAFDGINQIEVDERGDLVLTVPRPSTDAASGDTVTLRLQKPIVYQRDEHGEKQLLAGTYVLVAGETSSPRSIFAALHTSRTPHVAFQVASYDASQPLVIDPVLSWATYLGGSGDDVGYGITVDPAGNAYVTGYTVGGFPGTAGSLIQSAYGGGLFYGSDAFVTKLNSAGTALIYSTYLGGSGDDFGDGIAVDPAGNAYVTGQTSSPNFPGTSGSRIQSKYAGDPYDAFVTKLNPAGTALVYSTYLGGSGNDAGYEVAVDPAGNAYVTGYTVGGFPGTASSLIQSTYGDGASDAFVTKINAVGTALVYSTYLGGSGYDVGYRIAVDPAGNAYVTGGTDAPNFPGTAGSPIQSTYAGNGDGFVTKLNAAGTALVYSTYLGGSSNDAGYGIAVDPAGNAYVTGWTTSGSISLEPGFPVTSANLIQSTYGGGESDAFVTKINAAGTALVYSTYLGDRGFDVGLGIAVDPAGNAYVTGGTNAPNFPGTAGSPLQSTFGGGEHSCPEFCRDAFVTKLNAGGTALAYSTYLGGSGDDIGIGIVVDPAGNAYVTGQTSSSNFPGTASSPIQSKYAGSSGFSSAGDGLVAKITTNVPFAAFRAKAEIDVHHRHHGDEFEMKATLTLDPSSNGIAPLTEVVILQVGRFSTAIPAGSFILKKGRFTFEGVINGVKLEAVLRPLVLGNDYEFKVEGKGADFTGTKNPMTVGLTIGDDSGSTPIKANFE